MGGRSDVRTTIENLFRENRMHPESIDVHAEIDRYLATMVDGLRDTEASSLMMSPTYITGCSTSFAGKTAIAIDAGGTNLRIAKIRFAEDGAISIDELHMYAMPGSFYRVTADKLFDTIAEYTQPLLTGDDAIGFCFAYFFESTKDRDGKILMMSKEVDVSNIKGVMACQALEAAFQRLGEIGKRSYTMLNDTVSSMLGGYISHAGGQYADYAGLVMGTGFNVCYFEQTANITKLPEPDAGERMVINVEAGSYNGITQSTVEAALNKSSIRPGEQQFEKMIAGGYFGPVIFETLKLLADAGLFSEDAKNKLLRLGAVSLRTITGYINRTAGAENIYVRLTEANPQDGAVLDAALDLLYERVAKLVMIVAASLALKTGKAGDPERPYCICAEGTTFFKSPLMLRHLDALIAQFGEQGIHIRYVKTDNAVLIGSAVAALLSVVQE